MSEEKIEVTAEVAAEVVKKVAKNEAPAGIFSKRIVENAKERRVAIKRSNPNDGEFRSEDRKLAFQVAFSLSMTDALAGSKKAAEKAPDVLKVRDRLKAAGVVVGEGYTTKTFSEALATVGGKLDLATFIGFSEKSTRFPIFLKDGKKVLTVVGFNNPKDDVVKK